MTAQFVCAAELGVLGQGHHRVNDLESQMSNASIAYLF
jgi:hypothetical protein